jgi:hypothetical protein
MSEHAIFSAIHNDDCARVKSLLQAEPSLATFRVGKAKLYQSKIAHWIYVGDSPLHLAAAGYRVEIVRLLLAAGADPNSNMNHRQSGPLHYAADTCLTSLAWSARKQVETIHCLLEAGARINAQDKNGATPLHRAVRTRGAEAVRCLLNAGSDPLLKNKSGSTAFHLAVQNTGRGGSGSDAAKAAQRQIIHDFLSYGLDTSLKDGKGKSVLNCARSNWIRAMLRRVQ